MIGFDIETVPNEAFLNTRQWAEFKEKNSIKSDADAALYPQFGLVACVCAYSTWTKRKLSICSDDEEKIVQLSAQYFIENESDNRLGGQNIKGFDIPFMCCRFMVHGIVFPSHFQVAGKKPWEIPHQDTLELFKFAGGRGISQDALCLMLGIPSPKEGEVNAHGVWDAYKKKEFSKIEAYCGRDVNSWLKIREKTKNLICVKEFQ